MVSHAPIPRAQNRKPMAHMPKSARSSMSIGEQSARARTDQNKSCHLRAQHCAVQVAVCTQQVEILAAIKTCTPRAACDAAFVRTCAHMSERASRRPAADRTTSGNLPSRRRRRRRRRNFGDSTRANSPPPSRRLVAAFAPTRRRLRVIDQLATVAGGEVDRGIAACCRLTVWLMREKERP